MDIKREMSWPQRRKGITEGNAKAKADFQPTLDRLRSVWTAAGDPAPTGQASPASLSPYCAPLPTAPATQAIGFCLKLRQAYENDKKKIVLAYQLRRCVKKNPQAVQVR